MARHTRLLRIGGTYYFRAKVPKRIRQIIGKTEIRKSLGTKDPKEARQKVKLESVRIDRLFAAAERTLTDRALPACTLSDEEIDRLVSKYFVKLQQESRRMIEHQVESLPTPYQREDAAAETSENLKIDNMVLHQTGGYQWCENHWIIENFLAEEIPHLNIPKGSQTYNSLLVRLKWAISDNQVRTIDILEGREVKPIDLPNVEAGSDNSSVRSATFRLGELLDDFMSYQRSAHAETTPSSYKLPVRLLRDVIGEKTPLSQISRKDIEKACEILRRLPVNMTQRYPRLSTEQAVAAAYRAGDVQVLQPRTLSNYYTLIVAIFNYARDQGMIDENPAKSRKLRELFRQRKTTARRSLFTPKELNTIFHAPLYSGCKDDEKNYAKAGPRLPRRGRFWVPLLGLFHGLRCNEACQLYAEDVSEESEIPCLKIREELDHQEKSDKRVKNRASQRTVPIHPEILKIGFLDFVEKRREEGNPQRLFPELQTARSTGRYSHLFSKWFGRFLVSACGHKPKATFHSFRHHFRTALMNAGVSKEISEALGGWKSQSSSEYEYRHGQMSVLRKAIDKVEYPELDLRHLSAT